MASSKKRFSFVRLSRKASIRYRPWLLAHSPLCSLFAYLLFIYCHGRHLVSVCLSVCLSVRPSVSGRCCVLRFPIKTPAACAPDAHPKALHTNHRIYNSAPFPPLVLVPVLRTPVGPVRLDIRSAVRSGAWRMYGIDGGPSAVVATSSTVPPLRYRFFVSRNEP